LQKLMGKVDTEEGEAEGSSYKLNEEDLFD